MPFGGDDDGTAKAYAKLQKVADRRARNPRLSEVQAFAAAFRDNPELAAEAVR
jgi:hypothetical protein